MPDEDLQQAVAAATATARPLLRNVRREPLEYDAFLAGRTLARLHGVASTPTGDVAWSLIEKATDGPATASAYLSANAVREYEAYASGLLDDLAPGVGAPRVFAARRAADGGLTLWLEDLAPSARPLAASDIVPTAGDLGRLAGRWLGRVPAARWLFRDWMDRHGQPEAVEAALAGLDAARGVPALEARLGWRIDEAVALIERQASIRALLARLPVTLCHHDAVGANVFRRRRGSSAETVLIDWESVGPGPVAADLASLLFASPRRGDVPTAAVVAIFEAAIDAYVAGLEAAGAQLGRETVVAALDAAIGLRWTLARDVVAALAGGGAARRGSAPLESPARALDELIALSRVLLDRGGRGMSW